MNSYFKVSVFEFLERNSVVEVLGVGRVDGKSCYLAHIAAGFDFAFGNLGGNLLGGTFHSTVKRIRKFKLGKNCVHLGFVVSCFAEHLDNLAKRIFCSGRPFGNLSDSLVALTRLHKFARRNKDIVRH